MKSLSPDCVVFYSTSQCYVYDVRSLPKCLPFDAGDEKSVPSDAQIDQLQAELDDTYFANKTQILVVVPDAWLSISEHKIEHLLSSKLAPLAALTFAAETTFAPPESIYFYYHVTKLNKQSCQLKVIACSKQLLLTLSRPFKNRTRHCSLVSEQQWIHRRHHYFALYLLSLQGLTCYQPAEDKRKSTRNRWLCFVLLSGVLHLGFILFFQYSNGLHKKWMVDENAKHRVIPNVQPHKNTLVKTLLTTLRALPADVRLTSISSHQTKASVGLSLTRIRLQALLAEWRKEQPQWRWDIQSTQPQAQIGAQEVVDVELIVTTH